MKKERKLLVVFVFLLIVSLGISSRCSADNTISANVKDISDRLNQHYFVTLEEAKNIIEGWRLEYNTFRPHGSLNGLTPEEFRKAWEGQKQQNAPEIQLTSCTV